MGFVFTWLWKFLHISLMNFLLNHFLKSNNPIPLLSSQALIFCLQPGPFCWGRFLFTFFYLINWDFSFPTLFQFRFSSGFQFLCWIQFSYPEWFYFIQLFTFSWATFTSLFLCPLSSFGCLCPLRIPWAPEHVYNCCFEFHVFGFI